jgi:hypothetical protein
LLLLINTVGPAAILRHCKVLESLTTRFGPVHLVQPCKHQLLHLRWYTCDACIVLVLAPLAQPWFGGGWLVVQWNSTLDRRHVCLMLLWPASSISGCVACCVLLTFRRCSAVATAACTTIKCRCLLLICDLHHSALTFASVL